MISRLCPAPLSSHRVLIALTARERALFLAKAGKANPLGEDILCTWPADADLSDESWEKTLCESRPTIILSGWGMPSLPARWLRSPDCSLRYICHVAGSVRQIVPRSFLEHGGLVSNWGGFAAPFVAEHALLLALSALRHQNAWRPFLALPVAERQTESLCTRSLFRQKVGLHGFGGIARALLTLLRPFGVSVHAYSAGVPSTMIESEGVKACASLDELFRQSEILFECEALTVANERTVSAAVLAALPDGAVFVNVGRGRVVEEGALAKEAASGRIRIALDVTDETITPKSELFNIPDAILSPHIGGPSHDQYHQCGTLALQNIARFVRGETPHALVTLAIYDRST